VVAVVSCADALEGGCLDACDELGEGVGVCGEDGGVVGFA
jgi:hypothetical protein